jgi:hypothetical protein
MSTPLASRFVAGLFKSMPNKFALINIGRIASVMREVATYPKHASRALTASGGGTALVVRESMATQETSARCANIVFF